MDTANTPGRDRGTVGPKHYELADSLIRERQQSFKGDRWGIPMEASKPGRPAEKHEDSVDYRQELMKMMERETPKDELAEREILGLLKLERECIGLILDSLHVTKTQAAQLRAVRAAIEPTAPIAHLKPMPRRRGRRGKDPRLEKLRERVRQMRAARYTHFAMCKALGSEQRPPLAAWRDLTWPGALNSKQFNPSVRKWLSNSSK